MQRQPSRKAINETEEIVLPSGKFALPLETGFVEIAPALVGKVSRTRQLLSWAAGLSGFLVLIVAVLHYGSPERIIELARSAHPAWLLLAILVQAATYICAALVWRQALHYAGHPRPLRTLVPLGIAKLFTDQVLPSGGISGTMLVVRGLIRRRVPAEAAMAAMLVSLVSHSIAYLIVVLVSAGILGLHHRINLPLFIGVAVFVVITTAIPAAVFGLKRWGHRPPIPWLSKLLGMTALLQALARAPTNLLRDPGLLIQTTGLQLGIFMLDSLTLWIAFNSIGNVPEIWVVFVSFIVASMITTIGPIPVGLGAFEASSVGMLHFLGVSLEVALAGTLLLRAMTFWFPMIPGIWLVRREIGHP